MSDMALEFKLREFAFSDYHRMVEAGILREGERVELIDGAIVEMTPIGPAHWMAHARIVTYLLSALGDHALVVGKGSFPLGDRNEPNPDIAILAPIAFDVEKRDPKPEEIYAIVEIADSTLRFDTGRKLQLYARYGIRDYFVVDLNDTVLLHYSSPHRVGYGVAEHLRSPDTFSLARLPGIDLSAEAFLRGSA